MFNKVAASWHISSKNYAQKREQNK